MLIVATLSMFLAKDDHIYPITMYGFSFWLGIASACGFFLTSILFTINRINIRFEYLLQSYQKKLIETY
jgi:hypothetical protein